MSASKGFTSSQKNIKPPRAYPNADFGQQYTTLSKSGFGKHSQDVALRVFVPVSLTNTVIDAIQPTEDQDRVVFVTGHGAADGDTLKFRNGALAGIEAAIVDIPDANTLVIGTALPSDPIGGTTEIQILRAAGLTGSADGSLSISSGPLQYVLDGVPEQVAEDIATPANNQFLPVGLSITRDGVQTRIVKDTTTPANTIPVPIEIVSTSGTPATFNITTGDIAVHTTHDGNNAASFDSMRIGDGTNLVGVTDSNQLQVADSTVVTALGTLLTELELKADLSETQPISAASLPLPTGASTEATLAALLTELGLKADLTETQPVSAASLPLPTGAATQATLAALLTELQAKADLSETQPVSLASAPLPTGSATEAKQDAIITELQLKADLTETQPVSAASLPLPTGAATEVTLAAQSAKLPASLGAKLDTGSLSVVLASNQPTVETAPKAEDGGNGGSVNVTGLTTLSALTNQTKVLVQADVSNAETIRVTNGATDPTISIGWELLPGASLVLEGAFDVKAFATSAKLNFIQTTRS